MSNGTVLNSLLGITSANPASAKGSAAKSRADASERFHQAFEQARPEVAARKPAVRASSAENSSSEVRSASRLEPQRERPESVLRQNTEQAESRESQAGEHPVKTDKAASTESTQKETAQGSSEESTTNVDNQQVVASGEEGELTQVSNADNSLATGEAAEESLDAVIENTDELEAELAEQLVAEDDASSEIDQLVDPALAGVQQFAAPLKPTSVGVTGIKGESVRAGQEVNASNGAGSGLLAAAQAANDVLAAGENPDAAESEANVLGSTDSGENPDFLLLNSKAALNKLAEANMASADAKNTAIDLTKAPATVVEGLARLTEAQAPAARGFVVQTGMPVAMGSPQWSQAVGDKVLWLAAQNVSAAEIRLDPPELGPMQVKVTVTPDQQANVTFTSPHPAVREALDQQLNRLREMFSEQGLNLVNVDVSDKSFTQREQGESSKQQSGNTELDEEELTPVAVSQSISSRLVDHYA
ncbi:flagellar hook-length control protein FliK [Cellvibrio sp. NN19]|uniref:flagellar hook-length control protein FliK n=1 Tax=Cellvibrio chitinivorans TaxID=3102792 RepID=UPI002B41718F|nr:flagellar hook-length control protein FliK [Cellvibrio sp. NN19]